MNLEILTIIINSGKQGKELNMRNQVSTSNYASSVDLSFNEEGEFGEAVTDVIDTSLIPPSDSKRSEARQRIEELAEAKRLKEELRELDWFHSDDDLQ